MDGPSRNSTEDESSVCSPSRNRAPASPAYAGANVEAETRIGHYTPLHIASRVGDPDITRMLLEAGFTVKDGSKIKPTLEGRELAAKLKRMGVRVPWEDKG